MQPMYLEKCQPSLRAGQDRLLLTPKDDVVRLRVVRELLRYTASRHDCVNLAIANVTPGVSTLPMFCS
jgi:hypothetical protein